MSYDVTSGQVTYGLRVYWGGRDMDTGLRDEDGNLHGWMG